MEKKDAREKGYIRYEDFLDFCDEDTLAEWVDGKIERYSPASDAHQDLSDWLTSVLRVYVEAKSWVSYVQPLFR